MSSAEKGHRLLQFSANPRSREAILSREGHAGRRADCDGARLGGCGFSPTMSISDSGFHGWDMTVSLSFVVRGSSIFLVAVNFGSAIFQVREAASPTDLLMSLNLSRNAVAMQRALGRWASWRMLRDLLKNFLHVWRGM